MVLPELHLGRGRQVGPITVFPIWVDDPEVRGLVTGSTAAVEVGEATSANVPTLQVRNAGTKPVLLLGGELLEGGLQTRTVNHDLVLAPRSEQLISVSCVEQGRWGGGSSHLRRARRVSPKVQATLRSDSGSRQGDVWQSIQRYEQLGGSTATSSLADHLDRLPPVRPITALQGQRGVLIGTAEQPLSLDIFGSAKALQVHLVSIVDAARLDAEYLPNAGRVPGRRARRLIARLEHVDFERTREDAGLAVAIGVNTPHVAAQGAVLPDGRLAHVTIQNLHHPLLAAA